MIQQLSAFRRVVKKFADKMMMITVNGHLATALPGKLILMGMLMSACSVMMIMFIMVVAVVVLTVIDYNMQAAEMAFFDRVGMRKRHKGGEKKVNRQ